MNNCSVTWLGHSCFVVEWDNIKIMFDPYRPNSVPGLKLKPISVNRVYISHQHDDHNFDGVPCFLNYVEIDSKSITTYHDNQNGKLRGLNKIHILNAGGYKIVHMGDIGCDLTYQQIQQLKGADLILIPINGYYTIGAKQAYEIFKQVRPKLMVPMHYYYDNKGYKDENQLDTLLKLFPSAIKTKDSKFNLKDYISGDSKILILDYQH